MTHEDRAQELVNGFFIGGGGDNLHQPNLTKYDLVQAIKAALSQATDAANIQVDEMRKERDGFRVGYLRHRLSLEEAAKRWCWCKQEEIPGNCAKCVAEIALRPVEKPNCACPPDRQGHYPSCGTTVIIIPAVAEKRIADGATCPACGLGVTGVDPLCEKHYSEYLGQNRARGNNEDD